ncbi:TetR/AcrR family transcriptional regulator [Hyphomicrobiales bacterium 4NK60-0047b]
MNLKKTLTSEDWIRAAFRALTDGGPGAIRVEAIARRLKVSKGSFYWHFKDVASLQSEMLEHWQLAATEAIIENVDDSGVPPEEQLFLLVKLATSSMNEPYGGVLAEAAIRDWGRYYQLASETVKTVDEKRLIYTRDLFLNCGLTEKQATQNANLLYGALIGLEGLDYQQLVNLQEDMLYLLELMFAPN